MKDRVFIEGLAVITTIGIYEWEKTIKQKLILDIEMAWDNHLAGKSDDVTLCLDYAAVSEAICKHITMGKFGLIECVAEEVANLILERFSVPWIRVKVSKPTAISAANNVGVIIERKKI